MGAHPRCVARETDDDLRPFALGGKRDWPATARWVGAFAGVVISAIVSATASYRTASTETQARVQSSKNKSEAGYQVTRQAVEALEQRVLVLEERAHKAEVATAKAKPPRPAHRGGLPAPPAPPPPAPPAKQLPANLDVAERQVYNGVAASSAPRALLDAGPP